MLAAIGVLQIQPREFLHARLVLQFSTQHLEDHVGAATQAVNRALQLIGAQHDRAQPVDLPKQGKDVGIVLAALLDFLQLGFGEGRFVSFCHDRVTTKSRT